MRALARDLEKQFGTRFEVQYDSGALWYLSWSNGPVWQSVDAVVQQASAGLDGAEVRLRRSTGGKRVIALAVIRVARAGELEPGARRFSGQFAAHRAAEHYLDTTAYPEKAADDREEEMAARLMKAATVPMRYGDGDHVDEYLMCKMVEERGIGWLLLPDQGSDQPRQTKADGDAGVSAADGRDWPRTRQTKADNLALRPLERLTAHYAEGDAAWNWQRLGHTLPARAAVDAALADPELPDSEVLAVLALWRELQAEIDAIAAATARRITEGVGRKAITYEDVGDVLGITRQYAHTWVNGRVNDAPLRRKYTAT